MTQTESTKPAHIQQQKRRPDGRVVSTYSNAQLYDLVAKVARTLKPQAPETLSVREFDRTVASLGYADAPSARAICARLKRGWPAIVVLALDENRSVKKTDVPKQRGEAEWLTDRHLVFSLNRVALFKGVETMTEDEYDRYLEEFLASRPEPAHVLGPGARFPTSSQIRRIAKTLPVDGATPWAKALNHAQLQPVSETGSNALTVVEAINLYIEATGCQFYPVRAELPRLRSELGVSFQDSEEGRTWSESVQHALDARTAAGLTVPTMKAGKMNKPLLVMPPDFQAPEVRAAKGTWEQLPDDALVTALIPYVQDCLNRPGQPRPRQGDYKEWSKGRNDVPSASTLGDRKPWREWIALVENRLLERKKAA